jgi:hypothetical protein
MTSHKALKGILGFLLAVIIATAVPARAAEYRTFGIFAGASFPKVVYGKVHLNFAEHWAIDYQASLGIFWAIQQGELFYFFDHEGWSPYIGVGYQNWNFYGFSSSTNYNGVIFGGGNQATAVTVPLGLMYVTDVGLALDLGIAADVFTNAPADLNGKVVPEAQVAVGYFF